jgi:hypothetical protein
MPPRPDRPDKLVLDWNSLVLGKLRDQRRDPRTGAARSLVVDLGAEARLRVGASRVEIPVAFVHGVRPDAITLDRSLEELRRGPLAPAG